ncbi:hypothetical protein CRG98_034003 [Punica granatum]|uniref:Uncharacterized protein n=1 Tax=Punica granatum TaxID=22663 RepID=A0A2I0INY5_PUNGR|nr:hypothetical protein CRG98_034003 [Punica granatum]
MKGLGLPVGDPDLTIKVADVHRGCHKPQGWGWVVDWWPQPSESTGISNLRSWWIQGRKPPICGPDPTSMIAGIICGCMRLRWWGWGCQPAISVPSPFFPLIFGSN